MKKPVIKQNTFKSDELPFWAHSADRQDTNTGGHILYGFAILFCFIAFVICLGLALAWYPAAYPSKPIVNEQTKP
jgi:hypothetical protein